MEGLRSFGKMPFARVPGKIQRRSKLEKANLRLPFGEFKSG